MPYHMVKPSALDLIKHGRKDFADVERYSADPKAFDPYRSPAMPEVPYAGGPQSGRPGLLTTICVICIVLGALGLISSLAGAVGAFGGRHFQARRRES